MSDPVAIPRGSRKTKPRVAAVMLVLAGALPAAAEDRNPPRWRGQALSTYQHWTFSVPPPNYPNVVGPDTENQPPTRANNPFATRIEELSMGARGLLPPKVEWLDRFLELQGVWRLELVEWGGAWTWGYLEFGIQNADKAMHSKEIRVQVTSKEVAGPPVLVMVKRVPPPGYWGDVPLAEEGNAAALAGGVTHRTYAARLPDCPSGEVLSVHPPKGGVIYVDQVVVDTICRPPEKKQR